jgi:predicted transcriptional regulator
MQVTNVKQEAHRLVDNLPENATWDDLMYQIYVRQAIESGLEDSEAGRTIDVKEVRTKFGLSSRKP